MTARIEKMSAIATPMQLDTTVQRPVEFVGEKWDR